MDDSQPDFIPLSTSPTPKSSKLGKDRKREKKKGLGHLDKGQVETDSMALLEDVKNDDRRQSSVVSGGLDGSLPVVGNTEGRIAKDKQKRKKKRSGTGDSMLEGVDAELKQFLENVQNLLNDEDFEYDRAFFDTFASEIRGVEHILMIDEGCSAILENVVSIASSPVILQILSGCASRVSKIVTHRVASHVVERILERSFFILARDSGEAEEDRSAVGSALAGFFLELQEGCTVVLTNPQGSHVLRNIIGSSDLADPICGPALEKLFDALADVICSEMKEQRLSTQSASATVISALLPRVRAGVRERVIRALFESGGGPGQEASSLIIHPVGSHLIESILDLGDENLTADVYAMQFEDRLVEYSCHSTGNYVVQKLFLAVSSKKIARKIVSKATPCLGDFFSEGRPNVVLRLVEMCGRLHCGQGKVMKALKKALTIEDGGKEEFVRRLCQIEDKVSFNLVISSPSTSVRCATAGSRIVQALLLFSSKHVHRIVDGIISLGGESWKRVALSGAGSRLVEAALDAVRYSPRAEKICALFFGGLEALAVDPCGSHVVEKCFFSTSLESKERIAEELCGNIDRIRESSYGRIVVNNCRMSLFIRKRVEWRKSFDVEDRKRKVLDEIFGEDPRPKKRAR